MHSEIEDENGLFSLQRNVVVCVVEIDLLSLLILYEIQWLVVVTETGPETEKAYDEVVRRARRLVLYEQLIEVSLFFLLV